MTRIQTWLSQDGSYGDGLALLRETGFSGLTLRLLEAGENTYNGRRLREELERYVASRPAIEQAPQPSAARPDPVGPSTPAHESTTDLTADLKRQAYALMDERAELKAQLRVLAGEESAESRRRQAAYRILAIGRQLDELYSRLEFVDTYGYMPPEKVAPQVDIDDRMTLLNVRTYVSRYRNKVKAAKTDAQRQAAQALLQQYDDERKRLELKLKQPNDPYTNGQ